MKEKAESRRDRTAPSNRSGESWRGTTRIQSGSQMAPFSTGTGESAFERRSKEQVPHKKGQGQDEQREQNE